MEQRSITYEEQLEKTGYLVWTIVGISMMPLLRQHKDIITVTKKGQERCKKYDTVLFRRPGKIGRGKYVLHRILRVYPDGTYWIVGDNCISGEIVREEDVLGILSSILRDGKTISVRSLPYRLYVYLWCAPYPLRFLLLRQKSFLRRCLSYLKRKLAQLRKK